MRHLVVLGTGTGVGKTYVTEALSHALRSQQPARHSVGLKPVETGVTPGRDTDAARLARASSEIHRLESHSLYVFPEAISPHLAARRAGTRIDVMRIRNWVAQISRTPYHAGWCLIETAGGALSPLNESETNLDLALALEPAIWLLVAPDSLGALHDTRATLMALEHSARLPDLVVVNAARVPDAATGTTASELAWLGISTVAACIAHGDPSGVHALARKLVELADVNQ